MPDDIDDFMAKRRKPAAPVAAAPSSDIDDFMSKRQTRPDAGAPRVLSPFERQEFNQPRFDLEADLRRSARFNRGRPAPPQPQTRSLGTAKNLGLGAEEEVYGSLVPSALSGLETLGSAMTGDFGPLKETGVLALRGAGSLLMGGNPSFAGPARSNEEAIRRINAERQARQQGDPIYGAVEKARQEVEQEAAQDPSLRGRITRGVGRYATAAAPTVAAGIATGGSVPAIAATSALQSLDQPENMALNAGLAALPAPAARGLARRVGGRTAAAAPEAAARRLPQLAEEAPRYTPQAKPPQIYAEPFDWANFEVKANLNPRRPKAPGAVGPRAYDELAFNYRGPKSQAAMLPAPQQPRTPPLEVVTAVRKAGLLSGLPTHAKNVVGNLTFQPLEEVSRMPASIVDLAISVANRRRTITGPSPTAVAKSGVNAATTGLREAGQILRRGMTNQQAAQLQLGREINSGSKILDFYVNGVFRTLGAEDAVFRRYAFTRAVQDRAKAAALTEARQGAIPRSQISARAKQLEVDPQITADSILDSEIATFNNPSLVNRFVQSGMEAIAPYPGGRAANFGVELAIPFRNAPSNAVAKLLEYTPLGLLKNGAQVIRAVQARAFTPEMQRQFSTTMGRTVTGSSLILLGYQLGKAGLMTGYSDTDPSKRNRDVAAGRTPGAILDPITNTWHSLIGVSPIGPLLVIGATLQREEGRELKDESRRGANMAAAVTQTIKEQPLMSGAKDISEAISQPGSTGARAGRIAGSFVPTMVSKVGELTDSQRREGKGFFGQIQKRIPGARNYLPEQTDVLGRPLEQRKTGFFDPTYTSAAKERTDPLMKELTRLDVGLTAPQRDKDAGETEEAYRERKALAGRWFETYAAKLMESRAYRAASRDEQKAAISRLLRNVHDESDNPEPNTERFNALAIIEAVRESAHRKAEKQRFKRR
jgi:hypothetical protein